MLKRFLAGLALAFMLLMLVSERASATIIMEDALPTDHIRGPFGIDVARNGSFVVFAEKHAGKIGFLGTGMTLLTDPVSGIPSYNTTFREFPLPGVDGPTAEPRDVEIGNQTLGLGRLDSKDTCGSQSLSATR
jgi:hypothetical protein